MGPITSSLPSGHAATDLAFTLGVAQEIPALFPPLAFATSAAHWSLVVAGAITRATCSSAGSWASPSPWRFGSCGAREGRATRKIELQEAVSEPSLGGCGLPCHDRPVEGGHGRLSAGSAVTRPAVRTPDHRAISALRSRRSMGAECS